MLRGLAQCQLQCLQDCRCALLAPRPAACRGLLVQASAARTGCSWQGDPCLAPPRLQPCAPTSQRVYSTSGTVKPVPRAKKGKLCLIDGHNLAYRAFYGIYKAPMTELKTKDGIPTTVTFGFVRTLLALLEQEQPDALVVVFDAPGGTTFRRELLPDYKATRSRPPPEFAVDLTNLQLLLQFTRIPTLSVPGFEADDVMAGLAAQAKAAGWRTLLVSTDKDLWQVVDDAGGVSVLPPSGSSSKSSSQQSGVGHYITEAAVQEALGVPPQRVPDFKGLSGDSSDNIKGVPGIGPKTASQLLQKHGDLESVFLHAEGEKKGVAAKLAGQQEAAALFKDLATVRPEAAPVFDVEAARLQGCAAAELEPLLTRLEMTSLVKDMARLQRLVGGAVPSDPARTAALPAALQCLADSAALMTSGHDEQGFRLKAKQLAAAAAAAVTFSPEAATAPGLRPLSTTDKSSSSLMSTSSSSGAALSSAAGPEDGVMSTASPGAHVQQQSVLAAAPAVRLITTQQDLQALVRELQQQQQAVVSWSWPQDTPYSPGNRQQGPPQVLCCAWQPSLQASSSNGNPNSSSSSKASAEPPAVTAAATAGAAAAAPRRRRRTRAATTMQPPPPQQQQLMLPQPQQAPAVQPVLLPAAAPEVSGVCRLHVAVVVSGAGLSPAALLSTCRPLLESGDHAKVLFESKRACTELRHLGIHLAGVSYDVLVAGCLPDPKRWAEVLDPQQQQTAVLPAMTQHVLHTSLADMAAALQAAAPSSSAVPLGGGSSRRVVWQTAAGAWANLLLRDSFTASMQGLAEGAQLQALLQSIELPLQAVLSDMEVTGVRCDKQLLLEQKVQLQAEVTALEQQLFSIAGRPFNLNSPKECSAVIFDELGLKGKGTKRTKSGYLSTSMSEIEKLEASPFKAAFTEWSRLSSLLTKFYGDKYLGTINTHTGRIHTTYHQVGIATGRLASSNPNMQAVPAHDERGRMFRAAFTADEGHLLVAADYSQVELRVMAALSGDEALLQAFAAGQDVHAATARDVLGKGLQDAITPEERQLGKRVNFSIVYGAGKRQVAAELGLSQKEATAILDNFKAAHPKMLEYKTHCMRLAVSRGYTLSAAGRRRCYTFTSPGLAGLRGIQDLSQLPDMHGLQQLAGRDDAHVLLQASNAPIQGTSADLLKAALIQLHQQLSGPPYCCRLMLTAHDDVLLEVPAGHWPKLQRVVERAMEEALPGYGLMLKADVAAGASWLECK